MFISSMQDTELNKKSFTFGKDDTVYFRVLFRSNGGTLQIYGKWIYSEQSLKDYDMKKPLVSLERLDLEKIEVQGLNNNTKQPLDSDFTSKYSITNNLGREKENNDAGHLNGKKACSSETYDAASTILQNTRSLHKTKCILSHGSGCSSLNIEPNNENKESVISSEYSSLLHQKQTENDLENLPLINFKRKSASKVDKKEMRSSEPVDELAFLMENSLIVKNKPNDVKMKFTPRNAKDNHLKQNDTNTNIENDANLDQDISCLLDSKTMPNFSHFVQKCNESFNENKLLDTRLDGKLKIQDENLQGKLKLLEMDLQELQSVKSVNNVFQSPFSENVMLGSTSKIEFMKENTSSIELNKPSEEQCEMKPIRKSPKRSSPLRKHHPYQRCCSGSLELPCGSGNPYHSNFLIH